MAFLQLALQREKAGRVGILRTSSVIFAYLFQILFTTDQGNSQIGTLRKFCGPRTNIRVRDFDFLARPAMVRRVNDVMSRER